MMYTQNVQHFHQDLGRNKYNLGSLEQLRVEGLVRSAWPRITGTAQSWNISETSLGSLEIVKMNGKRQVSWCMFYSDYTVRQDIGREYTWGVPAQNTPLGLCQRRQSLFWYDTDCRFVICNICNLQPSHIIICSWRLQIYNRCHTKRRIGVQGPAKPSFGMTPNVDL